MGLKTLLKSGCVFIGIAAMSMLLLTGCSSAPSTRTTSATTAHVPPAPPNASSVVSYFAAGGSPFLAFETATRSLDAGTVPAKSVCTRLLTHRYPLTNASYEKLSKAIKGIPNIAIEVAANQDLQAKLRLVTDCIQGKATQSDATSVESTSRTVNSELEELHLPS